MYIGYNRRGKTYLAFLYIDNLSWAIAISYLTKGFKDKRYNYILKYSKWGIRIYIV